MFFQTRSRRFLRPGLYAITLSGFAAGASPTLAAQQPQPGAPASFTAADYARAEKFMGYNTTPLVLHSGVHATWLPDDRFWYRTTTEKGSEAVLIDPAKAARSACDLPACADRGEGGRGGRGNAPLSYARSPDGMQEAFIRDWNLWVRDVSTGKETALTTDGVKDFGYATDNAGWQTSDHPIVRWSPDSKRIATFQQDQREVGEMYLVDTKVGHPTLHAWKYPLPGDKVVSMIQRVIIDMPTAKVVRLQMPPDQASLLAWRSTNACRGGEWSDVQWSDDGTTLAFVWNVARSTSTSSCASLTRPPARSATSSTRRRRRLRVGQRAGSNWRYLPASNEVIWFSERDTGGNSVLWTDLQTGKLKHAIDVGRRNVAQLLHVDMKARIAYFVGVGKGSSRVPYFRHLYRIDLDGKHMQLLTPADADHDVSLSTSGRFFVQLLASGRRADRRAPATPAAS